MVHWGYCFSHLWTVLPLIRACRRIRDTGKQVSDDCRRTRCCWCSAYHIWEAWSWRKIHMHSTHDQGTGFGGEAKEHLSQLQLPEEVSFLFHDDFLFPLFMVVVIGRTSLHWKDVYYHPIPNFSSLTLSRIPLIRILRRVILLSKKYTHSCCFCTGSFTEVEEVENLSSEKLQKLGWSYRPLEESLVDSIKSYKEAGILD